MGKRRPESPVRKFRWETYEAGQSSAATWETNEPSKTVGKEYHGRLLHDLLLSQYAMGLMTAKLVCLISHEAVEAGAASSDLKSLAYSADVPEGNGHYERRLKNLLPEQIPAAPLVTVQVPTQLGVRRQDVRVSESPHPRGLGRPDFDRILTRFCPDLCRFVVTRF